MNPPPSRKAHYVSHNAVTRVPRSFIFLDSEAINTRTDRGSVQTFRLACVRWVRRSHRGPGWVEPNDANFDTPEMLWKWVGDRCTKRNRTIVVAHNLAYDLRICDAFRILPAQGWVLESLTLNGRSTWCIWKRDGATLQMVDSMTWLPMGLDKVGVLVGIAKCELPAWSDDDGLWLERCRVDVQILATAFREILDWIIDADLGNFKPTGAGQAWAAYRHRFMGVKLLVHSDDEARAAERVASWAGRCEARQHGQARGGPFYEWDFVTAYAQVGRTVDVPTVLLATHKRMSLTQWAAMTCKAHVLAECEIVTETPTVPCSADGRIVWPVGEFRTTLWSNELQLALDNGAQVRILRAWTYRKAPALKDFAQWCIDEMSPETSECSPLVRSAVKHWSRSIVGRFGARWTRWEDFAVMPYDDVAYGLGFDASIGGRFEWMQIGRKMRRSVGVVDSGDAVVSIMSFVMAECRVRLWGVCVAAGWENVVYMDTDSVIVNSKGHEALNLAGISDLRVKKVYNSLRVVAPRQIVTDGRLRASGIPSSAIRVGSDRYESDIWSQMSTSFAAGEPDRVTISPKVVQLSGHDRRREHHDSGRTEPYRVSFADQEIPLVEVGN